MLNFAFDDLHEDIQSLTTHLVQSFEDTFFNLNFIDGSDLEPFYGKASKDDLPILHAPEYMLESKNPIILIYYKEDRRNSVFGIKIGPFKLSKHPILIITFDEKDGSFSLHFNVEAKFFHVTSILSYLLEITDNIVLRDLFGFYIDTVRVRQKEKWQKIECFNFGDFHDHQLLFKALEFVRQHYFPVSSDCLKNDYAFCLDLNKGYDPLLY